MATIQEQCTVCGRDFDVTFRYQMEERDGGFVFFCSQECLGDSQAGKGPSGDGAVTCSACAKRFGVNLASQVFYLAGIRRYACTMACRAQIVREADGARLGDIAGEPLADVASPGVDSGDRISQVLPLASVAAAADVDAPLWVASSQPKAPVAQPAAAPAVATNADEAHWPPRRIAVFNHKGGTGKTTTSVSLAAGLAARGHRVLLVDTDSQGNVAVSLGAKCERSLYHVLVMGLRVADAIEELRPGLDLLPSNETLAAAELYLAGRQNRHGVLSQRMAAASEAYDYVIIDCSPSLSLMNQNALVYADSVLVPVACDYLSLVGVRQVIKTVKNVNGLLRSRLQIWGVLPTFYDSRAKICTEALATLRSHFGARCLPPVRASTKLKEAPAQARPIFEHAPGTRASADYETLVDAVLAAEQSEQSAAEERSALAGGVGR